VCRKLVQGVSSNLGDAPVQSCKLGFRPLSNLEWVAGAR
jgi:hypothetical protein